ncbi:MAG: hypothetical protein PHU46_14695 [Rhodocyclaceae bacterium]|nr:hypothetical protein [Rhodocyclaceae bacterium]
MPRRSALSSGAEGGTATASLVIRKLSALGAFPMPAMTGNTFSEDREKRLAWG